MKSVYTILGFPGAGLWLTVHPLLLFPKSILHFGQCRCHPVDTLAAPAQEIVVFTFIDIYLGTINLDDFVADPVKKIAVMSHHQQGYFRAGQIPLQPLDCRDVEVVGRLVENQ